jgi:hypothetical protein
MSARAARNRLGRRALLAGVERRLRELEAAGPPGAGRLREGAWRWAGAEEGLNPANVKDILAAGEDLLVGTDGGLFQLEGEEAAVRPVPLADGAEQPQIGRIREDADREAVWVATTRGLYELKRQ